MSNVERLTVNDYEEVLEVMNRSPCWSTPFP